LLRAQRVDDLIGRMERIPQTLDRLAPIALQAWDAIGHASDVGRLDTARVSLPM
jgi:hypothetical protein